MKLTLEIQDNRLPSFLEMLKKLDFVKVVNKEGEGMVEEPNATYLASEKSLAKDWLNPEEDAAWKDL